MLNNFRAFVLFTFLIGINSVYAKSVFDPPECLKVAQNQGWTKSSTSLDINYDKFIPKFRDQIHSPGIQKSIRDFEFFKDGIKHKSKAQREKAITAYLTMESCENKLFDPNCVNVKAYCAQKIATTTLVGSYKKVNNCSKPWNRPHCGADYQTAENLGNHLDYLDKKKKEIDEVFKDMGNVYRSDHPSCRNNRCTSDVDEFYGEIYNKYELVNDRIKFLAEEARKNQKDLSEEEARKLALEQTETEIKDEFQEMKDNDEHMASVCDLLNSCYNATYEHADLRDKRGLSEQVAICTIDHTHQYTNENALNELEDFIGKTKTYSEQVVLKDLVRKTNRNLTRMNVRNWAIYYKSIYGMKPDVSKMLEKLPAYAKNETAKKYIESDELKKELDTIPKIDFDEQRRLYNEYAYKVNKACEKHREADKNNISYSDATDAVVEALSEFYDKSKIAHFSNIGSFADHLTQFDEKACHEKPYKGLTGISDVDIVKRGFWSLQEVFTEKSETIRDYIRTSYPKGQIHKMKVLKEMLKHDPIALKESLAQTLDPMYAKWICNGIKSIAADDYSKNIRDKTYKYAAIAGSAVATVLSAGAATPLLLASTGLGIANATNRYLESLDEREAAEGSYVTESKDKDILLAELEAADLKGEGALVDLAISLIPLAGSATNMIKIGGVALPEYLKNSLNISKLSNMTFNNPAQEALRKALVSGSKISPKMLTKALTSQLTKVAGEIPEAQKRIMETFRNTLKGATKETMIRATVYASVHKAPPSFFSQEGMKGFFESEGYKIAVRSGRGAAVQTLKKELDAMEIESLRNIQQNLNTPLNLSPEN